ncbi:alpha/beta hydrolase-fold protein [Gluconacetobacter asukensis]
MAPTWRKQKTMRVLVFSGLFSVLISAIIPLSVYAADNPEMGNRYVLEDTEVTTIPASRLHRDYQILVSLPATYKSRPHDKFPVIFLTDADYGFPVVRSIANRMNDHGAGMEDAVIVGLSYAIGDSPAFSRRRDYTPTPNGDGGVKPDIQGRPPIYGEAKEYQDYIERDIFPYVAAHYHVDMKNKIYLGHSYGGLFGVYCLLTKPEMFQHYIFGSPSLWFDNHVMFKLEDAYAGTHGDLQADIYAGVGSTETPDRPNNQYDMVRDLQTFIGSLRKHHYPHLKIQMRIFQGEDHLTVFPLTITHGLIHVLEPNYPKDDDISVWDRKSRYGSLMKSAG